VLDGELPVNHAILGNLQDAFNLLPNLGSAVAGGKKSGTAAEEQHSELARAMSIKTNDQLMAIYLSSLIRAITAFHDLIENKIQNRQQQEEKDAEGHKDEEKKDDEKVNGESKDKDEKEKGVNGVNGEAKSDAAKKKEPKGKGS
jgi:26S proteasome regulatory subunit N8